ncbi:type I secretion system permease/ATPase [Aeromonas veronii]|uniref:type I secretion system permease/ATPase n=1 Tax=Aeromonas veronii TaxID=654 RepID=UPI0019322CD8|nr:type I secretion system permease/ATPase [Aeromonas veronii]MBM0416645.1 type I secretion system permease/ATPase [Aeromonas veronii]MBW3788505.1 type I secretion system permease/ATPase [Aeromonas veronii]MCF5881182.1 type I secretion system permease/ATPase [Aeromonas veronii]
MAQLDSNCRIKTLNAPISNDTKSAPDYGLVGLTLLAHFHGVAADSEQIKHQHGCEGKPLSDVELLLAARGMGLKAKIVSQPVKRLSLTPLPAMALRQDGEHIIIARYDSDKVLVHDLCQQKPRVFSLNEFESFYEGKLLLIASRASVDNILARFDFTWFVPAVVKYRKLLLEVLGISLVLQLFALVTPLFFQVVMDKVLVNRAFSTLDVISVGLLLVVVFNVLLSTLRSHVFAHTTSRIDVELGARLFRHLLALPLAYFEARRVGDTVARVRELEHIRGFLTGQALTTVLDLLFSFVFLSVMFYYSGWLTLVVLISLPCYAAWSFLLTPMLRRRLDEKFSRGADNQSFLVEAVGGVSTIKSMAVEPHMTRRWDNQLAAYVAASFRVTRLSNIGQGGIQLIQKLVMVGTLWLGARLVIDGSLSVGQLIAFNMLAGQVSAPVLRLAQLWQDFQQVGISVERLGDILNTRTEVPASRAALPPIQGRIQFDRVTFRYRPDGPEILHHLDLSISPGEIIGIVGRSGSGKSTLTKLIQRLYVPEGGRVLVDGNDLALADPAWLRRQIGVVLQENLLFNATVRDNIALSDPGVSLDRVIHAAKLAGAHDFIMELAEGYDTLVGEHGSSLSGGQRQRIAIARALMGNPRILILDEATSALDYESERAVMQNMQAICRGRTVIIIAHRLSTVRSANRIIAMDKGRIVESGVHAELVSRPDGYYAHLHRLQQG